MRSDMLYAQAIRCNRAYCGSEGRLEECSGREWMVEEEVEIAKG